LLFVLTFDWCPRYHFFVLPSSQLQIL
jgi:hypothetical protein